MALIIQATSLSQWPQHRTRQETRGGTFVIVRRLAQLYLGLALYGLGIALQVASRLGNDPWDTLHQGLARHTGLSIGTWIIIVGALVMALWLPLRQRPGLGMFCFVVFFVFFVVLFLWLF